MIKTVWFWFQLYIYISVDWWNQKTASLYTYQSTYAIIKWHIIAVLHISNGEKIKKGGVGCKKGGCCVLSTTTCVYYMIKTVWFWFQIKQINNNNSDIHCCYWIVIRMTFFNEDKTILRQKLENYINIWEKDNRKNVTHEKKY